MADVRRWLGTAAAVAQVDTLTPGGTIEVGDKFIVTLTAEDGTTTQSVSVSCSGTTVESVCDDLVAALSASTQSLFALITWSDETTHVAATAKTAGRPFYCAASTTESDDGPADDQTFVRASSVANSGPNDFNTAANWQTDSGASGVPVAGDTVVFASSDVDVLYGLDQSSVDLASVRIDQSYTGLIGLHSADAALDAYWRMGGIVDVSIGECYSGTAAGSGRIKIDLGAYASTVNVWNSAASPEDTNHQAIRIKGNSSSIVINVWKGKVGLATGRAGETTTIGTLNMGYVSNVNTDADVVVGPDVTITEVSKTGGVLDLRCAATTVTQKAGTMFTTGSGAITTLSIGGGTATLDATGTITTLNTTGGTTYPNAQTITTLNWNGGIVDGLRSGRARTWTTLATMPTASGTLRYNPAVVTVTNKLAPAVAVTLTVAAA